MLNAWLVQSVLERFRKRELNKDRGEDDRQKLHSTQEKRFTRYSYFE
jgi:hypothetical protein